MVGSGWAGRGEDRHPSALFTMHLLTTFLAPRPARPQLFCYFFFAILTLWTHLHRANGLRGKVGHRRLMTGLYFGMVCLVIRNIFRFVEFTQATILTWPVADGVYVLSEQQVSAMLPSMLQLTHSFSITSKHIPSASTPTGALLLPGHAPDPADLRHLPRGPPRP